MENIFEMFAQDNVPQEPISPVVQSVSDNPVIESVSFTGKTFVISVGGSILLDEKPRTSFISKFTQAIHELHIEGYRFALVVGGGSLARTYIATAKNFGATNFVLDELGITASRLNAQLLIHCMEEAFPEVITSISQARQVMEKGKIPILGGLLPGITTDTVAVLLAECLHADFINLTNTDGVYSADPKENPNAKRFLEMDYEQLLSLIRVAGSKPGQNIVLDLPSCLILKRSNIRGLVMDGNDLENFKNAVRGHDFIGTRIQSSDNSMSSSQGDVEFM